MRLCLMLLSIACLCALAFAHPKSARKAHHQAAATASKRPSALKPPSAVAAAKPAAAAPAAADQPNYIAAFPLIGMWYTPWWDKNDQFGHWAGARGSHMGMPTLGAYSSNDLAIIRAQYDAMRECGVDFLIMDDTNTLFVDNSIIDHSIRAWFDFMDSLPAGQRLPICIAFGGELNQHSCVKCFHDAANYIWDTYAQRPSYFRLAGKPLALWYIENDVIDDWQDPRFTVRRCYHFFRTQDQAKHEGWGWGSLPDPPDNSECMSFGPGWGTGGGPLDRRGGDHYEDCWVKVLKAHPRYVAIADWNQWDEHTAIEDSTRWVDHYGAPCPNWYRQITRGYGALRVHQLLHGFYYKDESSPDVYYCTRHMKLVHVPEYPHQMPTIITPAGWLDSTEKLSWTGALEPEP